MIGWYRNGTIEIRPATKRDGDWLATRLRKADRREIWSAYGMDGEAGFWAAFNNSEDTYSVVWKEKVVVIFGVCLLSRLSNQGGIWMLATDQLDEIGVSFARNTRKIIQEFLTRYSSLVNWVDCRNTQSIAWLRINVFEIREARPYGVFGEPFHYFYQRKKNEKTE